MKKKGKTTRLILFIVIFCVIFVGGIFAFSQLDIFEEKADKIDKADKVDEIEKVEEVEEVEEVEPSLRQIEKIIVYHEDEENIYTFSYDEKGNIKEIQSSYPYYYDFDEEGNLLYCISGVLAYEPLPGENLGDIYEYDKDGNLIRHYWWVGGRESTDIFEYENGLLVKTKRIFDGYSKYDTEHIYNSDGKLSEEFFSAVCKYDSQYDEETHIKYEYDDKGNLISKKSDKMMDGIIDSIYEYTYDSNGNLVKKEIDLENDGIIDVRYIYTCTQEGEIISCATDYEGDGESEFFYSTEYNLFEISGSPTYSDEKDVYDELMIKYYFGTDIYMENGFELEFNESKIVKDDEGYITKIVTPENEKTLCEIIYK